MPNIGDVILESEIGRNGKGKLVWRACIDCGKERWVEWRKKRFSTMRCPHCGGKNSRFKTSGEGHPSWKGGRFKVGRGYIMILLSYNDFFLPMATAHRKVLEHRLVVAKALGRNLHRWEIVHHINGIKDDNRMENLQLVTDDRHKQITILENRIRYLEKRVLSLEVENISLKGRRN